MKPVQLEESFGVMGSCLGRQPLKQQPIFLLGLGALALASLCKRTGGGAAAVHDEPGLLASNNVCVPQHGTRLNKQQTTWTRLSMAGICQLTAVKV